MNKSNHRKYAASSPQPTFGSGQELVGLLQRLEGSSYGAYKKALGTWDFGDYQVIFDRLQSDPYAPPSAVRVRFSKEAAGLPEGQLNSAVQKVATADFLARNFRAATRQAGCSSLSIAPCGQEILERSSATVLETSFELRIQVRMPARGRTILGKAAASIFTRDIPQVLGEVFGFQDSSYREEWQKQVMVAEDYHYLRDQAAKAGLVAFIANGSNLARASGISQLPLPGGVLFTTPESLQRTFTLPHAGDVTGMGIPKGITLLVGGGYHGKSTVLNAIERAVYPHVPGDGRELVVAVPTATKIRAADGRPVTKVDVSPFINHLPTGVSTREFTTTNASGSTSQAASLIEAVQAGARMLLIDEDTSATNLLIRDARMRQLVSAAQEPITPLIDRVVGLHQDTGTSLIMVMGGSSDYLDVADLVLQMDAYVCLDVTERAQQLVREHPRERSDRDGFPELRRRAVISTGSIPQRSKTKASGLERFDLDRETVDVSDVEQIVDAGQTEAIAFAVRAAAGPLADGHLTVPELADMVERQVELVGLDYFVKFGARKHPAYLVRPRAVDIAAGINRLRSLRVH